MKDELREVLRHDPNNADAYFTLGLLYKENGINSRATSMLRKAIELQNKKK